MKNLKKSGILKRMAALVGVAMMLAMTLGMTAFAKDVKKVDNNGTAIESNANVTMNAAEETEVTSADSSVGDKAIGAAIAVGLAAACGGLGMGIAVGKAVEGISRQPEADGKIRTTLMLGLVFIETAIIYALIVAILIIFVM